MTRLQWVYVVIAFIPSVWFGWYGPAALGVDITRLSPLARIAQRWLNFVGSIFGWAALFVVIERLRRDVPNLGVGDAVVMLVATLVAFLGITGYLPYAILQLAQFMLKLFRAPAAGDNDAATSSTGSGRGEDPASD